ncbi:MAG: hypothetical protein C0600_06150 [Ignavibacteria bacterium]|nr:MAG: hypothetical protein C0600_06150 [Ignavibacteria bacterium]
MTATFRFSTTFILLIALLPSCDQSTEPGPGTSGPVMTPARLDLLENDTREDIAADAYVLALREMCLDSSRVYSDIVIDEGFRSIYEHALGHVSLAKRIDAVDSLQGIHALPRYAMKEFLLLVGNVSWLEHWKQGNRMTGIDDIDRMMLKWELEVSKVSEMTYGTMVILSSPLPRNMDALAWQFNPLNGFSTHGIRIAEPNHFYGDGPDIEGEITEQGVILHYSMKWGDCPSGCIYRHTWEFLVTWSGSVSLTSITGLDLP